MLVTPPEGSTMNGAEDAVAQKQACVITVQIILMAVEDVCMFYFNFVCPAMLLVIYSGGGGALDFTVWHLLPLLGGQ